MTIELNPPNSVEIVESQNSISITGDPEVTVDEFSNLVSIQQGNSIEIVDGSPIISVTQPNSIIELAASGPQGIQGPQGDPASNLISSVSNSDGSLSVSPTTGNVIASINPDHSNTFTQPQAIDVAGISELGFDVKLDYQGSSTATAFRNILEINTAPSSDPLGYAGLYSVVIDNHEMIGIVEDNSSEKAAFAISLFRMGNSSVDWQDGGETLKVYSAQMQNTGVFSGLKHPLTLVGFDTNISNDISYNNPSGNYYQEIYGTRTLVQSNGSVVAGTLTRNMYGNYIQMSSGGHGNCYGLYLGSIAGGVNNFPIYSIATGPSYLAGNLGIGTDSQFGSGSKVIALGNASVVPSTNPSGGGVLYTQGGALKYRGSSGTVTTLAAA